MNRKDTEQNNTGLRQTVRKKRTCRGRRRIWCAATWTNIAQRATARHLPGAELVFARHSYYLSALQPDFSHPLTTWGGAFSCSALCTHKKIMKTQFIYTRWSYQGCWDCIQLPPSPWKGTSSNRGWVAHLLQKAYLLLCSPLSEHGC